MKINRDTQTKHWKSQKSKEISEAYFTSPPGIKRSKYFAEHLKSYQFNSIFEVGCMSGRNLFYIQKSFPGVKIGGLDVNERAIKYAREKLSLGEELICMDAHNIRNVDKNFDIIFTSGVLIHIVQEDIAELLSGFVMRANKYIMHIEECGNGELIKGPKHLKPKKKVSDQCQWAPGLVSVYTDMGLKPKVINLPEDVMTNGAKELLIIEV